MAKLKKGLVHIYTGDGKGKTSCAAGLVLRAIGSSLSVCIFQFLKGFAESGEIKALKKCKKNLKVVRFKEAHPMFFCKEKRRSAKRLLKKQALKDFLRAKKIILNDKYDVIIMDEIINVVNQRFVPEAELIKLVDAKPKNTELILTGRGASKELIKKADYTTHMLMVKHPFCKGKKARKGIEF